MTLFEQFIASLSFDSKKVQSFRAQSVWKTITYLLILLMASNLLVSGYALFKGSQNSLYKQVQQLPELKIDKEGLTFQGSPAAILLPQLDTLIVVGTIETAGFPTQGMKNVIAFGEKQWTIGRSGFPGTAQSYAKLITVTGDQDGILTKNEILMIAKEASNNLKYFAPVYQYTGFMIDVVTQLVIISMLAMAGLSFRRFVKLSYKEVWTITAYGITAPILARTFLSLLGFQMSFLFLLYWSAVGFFSLRTIKAIQSNE